MIILVKTTKIMQFIKRSRNPNLLTSDVNRLGFTLIELLIVFAVIGILATIAVVMINPSEIMKEVRDSKRFEELNHINIAVSEAVSLSPNINLGVASSVYVSIPDSFPTSCLNLGLSTSSLPSGWSYRCSSLANFRKTDGTGWIPVNFSSVEGGSVFAALPVDPINATSSGLYYTYTSGGSFQLSALFESFKYADKAVKDGGIDLAQYETGDNLSLAPFSHGLVGYWKFDETSGATATDSSGFGRNGSVLVGTSTIQWITGKVGGALNFDSADDTVNVPAVLSGTNTPFTAIAWAKPAVLDSNPKTIFAEGCTGFDVNIGTTIQFGRNCGGPNGIFYSGPGVIANEWVHIAIVYNGTNIELYKNGVLYNGGPVNYTHAALYIGTYNGINELFNGSIDDVRIYNRALSASQIKAIYDATK